MNISANTSVPTDIHDHEKLEDAWILVQSTHFEKYGRIIAFGIFGGLGVICNVLSIFVLVKSKLIKLWTYGLVLNLTVADLLLCTNGLITWLPGVILGR